MEIGLVIAGTILAIGAAVISNVVGARLQRRIGELNEQITDKEERFAYYRDSVFASQRQENEGRLFLGLVEAPMSSAAVLTAASVQIGALDQMEASVADQQFATVSSALVTLLEGLRPNPEMYSGYFQRAVHCIAQSGLSLLVAHDIAGSDDDDPDLQRLLALRRRATADGPEAMQSLVDEVESLRTQLAERANEELRHARELSRELDRVRRREGLVRGVGFSLQILGLIAVSAQQAFS